VVEYGEPMSVPREIHLNLFIHGVGHHEAAWRLPESDPFANTDIGHFVNLARIAEAGKMDSVFFADGPVLMGDPAFRPLGRLEPTTLLGALSAVTDRIGLIATASTSYKEPYDLARTFGSLDHISGGRAGWNIVTTAGDDAARNFGRDGQADHKARYDRATDFLEVVTKLWDSWEDGAQIGDKDLGVFADREQIRPIDHVGPYFKVAGPLNVPRSPQGYPLLVQAGSSEDGKDFAARFADAVFTAQRTLEEGQEFYGDLKQRAAALGRAADEIVILPGIVPVLGSTEAEATARDLEFEERINPEYGLVQLSRFFNLDLTGLDLDKPLPDLPVEDEIEGHRSRTKLIVNLAHSENLTVRELLAKLGGGRGHRTFSGTPEQLADTLELWFHSGAADGFNIMPAALPGDLETFVDAVIPILQRRGLFRTDYEGSTLREHYGLPRPANRLAPVATAV
jgi:FMN-dependent oxidoreductase (nitrilotriacetate monooxygenase family)